MKQFLETWWPIIVSVITVAVVVGGILSSVTSNTAEIAVVRNDLASFVEVNRASHNAIYNKIDENENKSDEQYLLVLTQLGKLNVAIATIQVKLDIKIEEKEEGK